MQKNQFSLLKERRYLPFFLTQSLGAFNDNVIKNALIALLAFQSVTIANLDTNTLINLAAMLFILPFFLFSATAGQLADKYEKSTLIRWIKFLEILIMCAAAAAFITNRPGWLIALLFVMGTQSSMFGPIKYSIPPLILNEVELTGGNGLVQMGTFIAILLGIITGTTLIGITTPWSVTSQGALWVSIVLISIAILGFVASWFIQPLPRAMPDLKINVNPFTETWRIIGYAREERSVFLSILGVSWFWLLGATYLTQLANYTKLHLGGGDSVYTLLLSMFTIGIALGSLFCEKLSGRRVEIGLVPLGSIGLTVFGIHLFFAYPEASQLSELSISGFLQQSGSLRVLFDVILIGVFGGFYIVPLFALIQQRTATNKRARIIAANNILNALFMVVAAGLAIILLKFISIPQLFLALAVANALVAIYIYILVPEFTLRFFAWILISTLYRVKPKSLEQIPSEGPALLVCNHVSYVDPMIIGGTIERPVRFVMYHKIFATPGLSYLFRAAKAIPIAARTEDEDMLKSAYDQIAAELEDGRLVCIFPEGKITRSGDMNEFKKGIEHIVSRTPVPVIPMALRGLWGSFFSRYNGRAMLTWPRKLWSNIGLRIGSPIPPKDVKAGLLFEQVAQLRGEER